MLNKQQVLKQYFGFEHFRSVQAEVIDHILEGNDCMVLMPTGGGKSVCFQVPALILQGLTLVVSPLIALMKDQVQSLTQNGIAAAYLNSSQSSVEQADIENKLKQGALKLLYLSPEKLLSGNYAAFIQSLQISLIAIDESHCVSVWGHDFRPEYVQLNILKQMFPEVPIVALTATADKVTRRDILKQLSIDEAEVFVDSFDRPNLTLSVLPGRNRLKIIQKFIADHPKQSGIIYCFSRKNTEDLAESLRKLGIDARHYHAGMSTTDRSLVQDAFVHDNLQVIVATVAFGMGIDKSNVRWIVHYNMPGNVESFYQEIGRAGRDGLPADTLLFFSYSDFLMRRDLIHASQLPDNLKEIQVAKLERMKQYAETQICRRRILISYFNEIVIKDCGNCDVCHNPPKRFDGTIFAQKALSVVARTDQQVGMTMVVDVLRGSRNKYLLDKGYQHLKTYGAGTELRNEEWNEYIAQMLNSGILDVAYDEDHALKLNETSWQVLKSQQKVELIQYESFEAKRDRQKAASEAATPKTQKEIIRDEFFEALRQLRKRIADSENVPPFVVFSDATLSDMAQKRPTNEAQMRRVSGVGQFKVEKYGKVFMDTIRAFQGRDTEDDFFVEQQPKPKLAKGETYAETYRLYDMGHSVADIAKQRNLAETTIYSHLVKLYEEGYGVDLHMFVSKEAYEIIGQAIMRLGIKRGDALKPLFDYFEEKYEYHQLRIAQALVLKGKEFF